MPKKLSGGVRFLLGFITFLLCIALFVATIVTIVVADTVSIVTSQENVKKIISQVLFNEVSRPMPIGIGSGNAPGSHRVTVKPMAAPAVRLEEASDAQTTEALVTWIFESLSEEYGEEMNLTLETVQQFVEESTLKDFIADKGASLVSDYFNGENTTTITEEEIKQQLELNKELIKETFDYEISDEVVSEITNKVVESDYIAQIQEEGIVNVVANAVGGATNNDDPNSVSPGTIIVNALETVRQVFSKNTVLLCIGACLVLLALILVTNLKQIWVGLNKAGITVMVAGALFLVPTIIIGVSSTDWMDSLGSMRVAGVLAREIMLMTAPICFIATIAGLVLLVSGIVTYCIVRSKYRKAQMAMNSPVAQLTPVVPVAPTIEEILRSVEPIAEEVPAEEPAAEEIVEEAPIEEAPVEEAPVEEAPVEEAPVEEAPAEEPAAEEAPVEEPTPEEVTE